MIFDELNILNFQYRYNSKEDARYVYSKSQGYNAFMQVWEAN